MNIENKGIPFAPRARLSINSEVHFEGPPNNFGQLDFLVVQMSLLFFLVMIRPIIYFKLVM